MGGKLKEGAEKRNLVEIRCCSVFSGVKLPVGLLPEDSLALLAPER